MKLTLVTGNKNKFESAKQHFNKLNVQFDHKSLEIIEPQDSNIERIVEYKATQAYEQLKSPILVADSGWNIPSLNGFPGPFMHYIVDWLDAQTLQNMLKDKNDRTVILENTLAYKDKNHIKVFKIERKGKFLKDSKGDGKGNWMDEMVTFRSDEKTFAQCMNKKLDFFSDNQPESIWSTFAKWYITQN